MRPGSVARRHVAATVAVVAGVVLVLSGVAWAGFRSSIESVSRLGAEELGQGLSAEVERRGELLARQLARDVVDPLLRLDLTTIGALAATVRARPDVAYVYVLDGEGRLLHDGTPEIERFDQLLDGDLDRRSRQAASVLVQRSGAGLDVAVPVALGEQRLGTARVGLSLDRVRSEQAALRERMAELARDGLRRALGWLALAALGLLAAAALVAHSVSRALTRPLARLADHARRVGEGQFEPVPGTGRRDEIGELARAFQAASDQRREAEQGLARARDEALEASRAKTVFLSTMSHELRTPLNHVLGYGGMLREELEADGSPLAGDAARVEASARSLLALVQGVLDLSKIESDRMTVALQPTDLAALAGDCARQAQDALSARGNTLELRVDPALREARLLSDPQALARILGELLSNAAKFTERGAVVLEAALEPEAAVVSVRDTGVGIEAAQLERVFQPFTQADERASRRFEGAGLGLAISRGLARLVGGTLSVESEPGRGSTFTLRLPRA